MAHVITISEAASIALHSIILIAKSELLLNVGIIANKTSTSKHHVAKVLQLLVKQNYLTSQRGPQGGFSLKKDPNDITFLQIYEAVEGEIEIPESIKEKPFRTFDKYILNNIVEDMTIKFRDYLKSQKLSDYLNA